MIKMARLFVVLLATAATASAQGKLGPPRLMTPEEYRNFLQRLDKSATQWKDALDKPKFAGLVDNLPPEARGGLTPESGKTFDDDVKQVLDDVDMIRYGVATSTKKPKRIMTNSLLLTTELYMTEIDVTALRGAEAEWNLLAIKDNWSLVIIKTGRWLADNQEILGDLHRYQEELLPHVLALAGNADAALNILNSIKPPKSP